MKHNFLVIKVNFIKITPKKCVKIYTIEEESKFCFPRPYRSF